ncbi:MAG: hypothetical protein Q4P78_02930 [Rothia sp. (in: high G+C Gram-positive bacteria)]|uniref:hypothetical protein n=1 Tax=Rothia sp. (in: high G+C Gram-positive bacteria) TaxID=1885016 RepID=UPI0026E065F2|nr:hypothetical protein [Rothia sp. (in: high G+C Gram-positive bacteria)]MDO5750143.1 hypothetical protein [Rothia sp. (in: high G+C Gram-positive bacteria)]
MSEQIPYSPQVPYGAPAPVLEAPAPVAEESTPAELRVPEAARRPYGEPPRDLRSPGYNYAFASMLTGAITLGWLVLNILFTLLLIAAYGKGGDSTALSSDSLISGWAQYPVTYLVMNTLTDLVPVLAAFILGTFGIQRNTPGSPYHAKTTTYATWGLICGGLGIALWVLTLVIQL